MKPDSPVGARVLDDGVEFRVWAPTQIRVEVALEAGPGAGRMVRLTADDHGFHTAVVAGTGVGTRYRYVLSDGTALPDPASRFQPDGVHGPSEVIDPAAYAWSTATLPATDLAHRTIYELHVGTFTPQGTFRSAIERLPALVDLGIDAIELMPVGDFAGDRNWGYDGVAMFAPARVYGRPDDLRALIDAAHACGLRMILDVVYNHLGPDGACLSQLSPYYFSRDHRTPWGAALNLDGLHSEHVRAFLKQNAWQWLDEYRFDGLRLDATHALIDDSPQHFLAELAEENRRRPHPAWLIAEDHRNLATMLQPPANDGWGLDGVWADDLHHQMHVAATGEREGYYQDFSGSAQDIAVTVRRGWFYCGQLSHHLGEARGTDPAGLPPERFVVCLQNHDQVGNRALGERLHHQIEPPLYRALSVLLLTVPQTPLLFMGQEWAASTPFLYFTDHHAELGRAVTEGRRAEFAGFSAFRDPARRDRIPDPQELSTFERSRLRWEETTSAPHAGMLRLYRALLRLRRELRADPLGAPMRIEAVGNRLIVLDRGSRRVIVALGEVETRIAGEQSCAKLNSEDPLYSDDPAPITLAIEHGHTRIRFRRAGALVF